MSKIRRRQRCPNCGSLDIISWGIRGGHHRYRCNNCGTCFTKHREDVGVQNTSLSVSSVRALTGCTGNWRKVAGLSPFSNRTTICFGQAYHQGLHQ